MPKGTPIECPACGGSGIKNGQSCTPCGGSGIVWVR